MTLTSPASGDDVGQIVAAAHRTLSGPSVIGSIATGGAVPHSDWFLLEPATGRCAISRVTVLDDTTEYALGSDPWRRTLAVPGARDDRDPRLLLELLRASSFTLGAPLVDDYGFELTLAAGDVGVLRDGGLAPDWTISATVRLAAWSPVSSMSLRITPTPQWPDGGSDRTWTFDWFDPPVAITMPDPAGVREYADWVAQQEQESYR